MNVRQVGISPDFTAQFLKEKRRTGGSTDECFNCFGDPDTCGCYSDQHPIVSKAIKACDRYYDQTRPVDESEQVKDGDLELSICRDSDGKRCFFMWGADENGILFRRPLSEEDQKIAQQTLLEFLAKNFPHCGRRG